MFYTRVLFWIAKLSWLSGFPNFLAFLALIFSIIHVWFLLKFISGFRGFRENCDFLVSLDFFWPSKYSESLPSENLKTKILKLLINCLRNFTQNIFKKQFYTFGIANIEFMHAIILRRFFHSLNLWWFLWLLCFCGSSFLNFLACMHWTLVFSCRGLIIKNHSCLV